MTCYCNIGTWTRIDKSTTHYRIPTRYLQCCLYTIHIHRKIGLTVRCTCLWTTYAFLINGGLNKKTIMRSIKESIINSWAILVGCAAATSFINTSQYEQPPCGSGYEQHRLWQSTSSGTGQKWSQKSLLMTDVMSAKSNVNNTKNFMHFIMTLNKKHNENESLIHRWHYIVWW